MNINLRQRRQTESVWRFASAQQLSMKIVLRSSLSTVGAHVATLVQQFRRTALPVNCVGPECMTPTIIQANRARYALLAFESRKTEPPVCFEIRVLTQLLMIVTLKLPAPPRMTEVMSANVSKDSSVAAHGVHHGRLHRGRQRAADAHF